MDTAPTPSFFDWPAVERATGCSRELYYSVLANMLIVAGERLVAGYMATSTKAKGARRNAYSLGICRPEPKLTREQEIHRDAEAFGLIAA